MEVKELSQSLDSLTNTMLQQLVQCNDRIEIGTRNAQMAEHIDDEIVSISQRIADIKASVNYSNRIYKNALRYLEIRKEQSMQDLQDELARANSIVPAADISTVKIKMKGKNARIVNGADKDINLREGSAARTVLSVLMRYVFLMYDPSAINVIFFDEQFNTLSDETLNSMRDVLEAFSKSLAIVGIEQQSVLFNGVVTREYNARKKDGITTITRVV